MLNSLLDTKNKILFFTLLPFLFWFAGCSTTRPPRPASNFLLNTSRSQVEMMSDLKLWLEKNKYQFKTFNTEVGFFVTEPREFAVKRPSQEIQKLFQTIYLRKEGGSVFVRITYLCDYVVKNESKRVVCYSDDEIVAQRILRAENQLMNQFKKIIEDHDNSGEKKSGTFIDQAPVGPSAETPPPDR